MMEYALFAGCLTGRRLKTAFGPICENIIWEEASPVVADNPRDYHPPDIDHVRSVLVEHKPDVVLCFTRRGEEVLRVWCHMFGLPEYRFLTAPHPAARGSDTVPELNRMATDLRALILYAKPI
jgi:hypothetical protein